MTPDPTTCAWCDGALDDEFDYDTDGDLVHPACLDERLAGMRRPRRLALVTEDQR